MVNHGVSRACKACKARREKCDETRPSCRRCLKAKRTCPGYQVDADLLFWHYRDSASTGSSHQSSTRPFDPTGRWLLVSLPDGTDDPQLDDHAVTAFLNDYCLVLENRLLSRGYLEGLETLLAQAGPSSDLAQATRVVALASNGTKLSRSALVHKARVILVSDAASGGPPRSYHPPRRLTPQIFL
ncbi:hypothetical protein V1517DRAFT_60497 [Lipomyces orientalis]|uniref:Uncharacterized protein n=1 Tax=Lipomyces orientalis TaxID=1233043 RepID=A0ACC3TE85_9ASCO